MSNEQSKPLSVRLREGYQPASAEWRGHQLALDKGYQPNAQIAVNLQPPRVGSAAVLPQQSSAGNQTQAGTNAKK
jgi:hypothetical protein